MITSAISQLSIKRLLKVLSATQSEGLKRWKIGAQRGEQSKTATPLPLHRAMMSIFGIKVCCSHS